MNSRIRTLDMRRARRTGLAIGVLAVALLAIPHLGFGGQRAAVAPPTINAGQEQRLVSVATHSGPATLYAGPATNGYECVTISVPDSSVASSANAAFGNGGGECHPGGELAQRLSGAQLTTSMSWVPVAGATVALIIDGRAGSAIQRVELQLSDGTAVPAGLSDRLAGYYVSRIAAPAIGKLPSDVAVVGYGAGGQELARVSLQDVLAAATP